MRTRPSLALFLWSLAALAASGCAHERDTMTFAEAGLADPVEPADEPTPPASLPETADPQPGATPQAAASSAGRGARAEPPASPPAAATSLAVARPPEPDLPPAPPRLHWPVDHAWVSSQFGFRHHPLDHAWRMHWGLDLSAPPGRVVGSAAPGVVVHAGWSRGYGLMVEVRHRGGLTTRYSHLARLTCAPGDELATGQALGLVGATGHATGPHLHFEVWRDGRARDPLAMLSPALARASD
ncbi:MAG TPA: M23 family metallopeptidase [Anaeromyxobacteraceae bacterium]|nr:M23 family metallopeptidase [Anaeromyxobacteraceae bacterium]